MSLAYMEPAQLAELLRGSSSSSIKVDNLLHDDCQFVMVFACKTFHASQVIDVRDEDFAGGHIRGAINIGAATKHQSVCPCGYQMLISPLGHQTFRTFTSCTAFLNA